MTYKISHPSKKLKGNIYLSSSKSESNRALIIQALCTERFEITNLSDAHDTEILKKIIETKYSSPFPVATYDVEGAGTTMRFLTAYLATQSGTFTLTGNERMQKRPIGILVDALRELGADIEYLGQKGFAPIKITGKTLKGGEVEMDGNVSSQFVSALLLIAPVLQNGLVIKFKGEVISRPYINMTLKMLQEFRVYGQWQEDSISVSQQNYYKKSDPDYTYKVEGDWSSASYWYLIAALSNEVDFVLKGLKHPSLQGDSVVANMFTFFGINSEFTEEGIRLTKTNLECKHFGFDFSDCPDLVQTVAVAVSALSISSFFNGVHTLKIKETDRIIALKNELAKLGASMEIDTDNIFRINPTSPISNPKSIATYDDHRMAMAFAALAMKLEFIVIEHPEVIKKSYKQFWNDLKSLGFMIQEIE